MDWLRRIPRPVILFAGITLVFLAAFAWLSWRVISQDYAVEQQRRLDRCELTAGNVAEQLTRQMADLQRMLADIGGGRSVQIPTQGIALSVFRDDFLEEQVGARLPYYPATRKTSEPLPDPFSAAEAFEFWDRKPLKAAALYAQIAVLSSIRLCSARAGGFMAWLRAFSISAGLNRVNTGMTSKRWT